MLAYGGLLSEFLQAGSAGIAANNPGLVKVAGGFVFPVGLVMCVVSPRPITPAGLNGRRRIVLQGQELLTSNMMVRVPAAHIAVPCTHLRGCGQDVPYGRDHAFDSVVESSPQLVNRSVRFYVSDARSD